MTFPAIAVVLLSCVAMVAVGQSSPRVDVVGGVIHVSGLGKPISTSNASEERLRELFSVYTDEAFVKGLNQAVAGKYKTRTDGFTFEPAYPFISGATYHAVFSPAAFATFIDGGNEHPAEKKLVHTFRTASEIVSPTTIEAVYPATEVLPENLLRMYICFSGPMMPGEAYEHITLVNANGERVERPFLIVDQELWDTSRTRLTILFDPGRIKRGLKSNLDLGPPLKEGQRYSLLIDSTWRDANGNSLERSFVKRFRVSAPERTRLTIDNLQVIVPPANSRGPLVIRFDRPIDRILAHKYVAIQDGSANTIKGQLELDSDSILTFTPKLSWQPGSYKVLIEPVLEDVAGNSFKNAFDLDLAHESRISLDETLTLQVAIVADMKPGELSTQPTHVRPERGQF